MTRSSKAEKHVAAGDRYVASGGSRSVRDAVDRTAAQEAAKRQAVEAARAELRRR